MSGDDIPSERISAGDFLRLGPNVSDHGSLDAASDQLKFLRQAEPEPRQTMREYLRAAEEEELGPGGVLAWDLQRRPGDN